MTVQGIVHFCLLLSCAVAYWRTVEHKIPGFGDGRVSNKNKEGLL